MISRGSSFAKSPKLAFEVSRIDDWATELKPREKRSKTRNAVIRLLKKILFLMVLLKR
ncbi:MAG: hypothetical protein MZV63_02620 [Marinilabiliales bacterium]|nr:hypothetical protein [Marinilabiliales bacterium]